MISTVLINDLRSLKSVVLSQAHLTAVKIMTMSELLEWSSLGTVLFLQHGIILMDFPYLIITSPQSLLHGSHSLTKGIKLGSNPLGQISAQLLIKVFLDFFAFLHPEILGHIEK